MVLPSCRRSYLIARSIADGRRSVPRFHGNVPTELHHETMALMIFQCSNLVRWPKANTAAKIFGLCLFVAVATLCAPATGQVRQNPSPMVEHTRSHPRLERSTPDGRRIDLEFGRLFIPQQLSDRDELPLFLHFHGGRWLPELPRPACGAKVAWLMAMVCIQTISSEQ